MSSMISDDVLGVLRQSEFEGPHLRLVGQLDRKLYVATNKVIEALGGKWNRKAKAHVFDGEAAEICGDAITAGTYLDAKKEFDFFRTPDPLSARLVQLAGVASGQLVLEPSAGDGSIAVAIEAAGGTPVCYEIQPWLCGILKQKWTTHCGDFLEVSPEPVYDRVVMNPPFSRSQDMLHVRHAWEFLKPGGVLVSIMGPGFTFRNDAKASGFREWLDDRDGTWESLPDGSFKESGTAVRTIVATVPKSAT